MTFNPLWERIQAYMDDPAHRYSPKPADLARETGISEQVLSKWRKRPTLPDPALLAAFSLGTGVPFGELMSAALEGKGSVPRGTQIRVAPGAFDEWARTVIAAFKQKELDRAAGRPRGKRESPELVDAGPDGARGIFFGDGSGLRAPRVSDPSTTTDFALAADPGDDAAGESESYNET